MTSTKMLIGSLSSDLYRVASLTQRGSYKGADRFLLESRRWVEDLSQVKVKKYIKNIIEDLQTEREEDRSLETAEKMLMYSILLQNYALHMN